MNGTNVQCENRISQPVGVATHLAFSWAAGYFRVAGRLLFSPRAVSAACFGCACILAVAMMDGPCVERPTFEPEARSSIEPSGVGIVRPGATSGDGEASSE